MAIVLKDDLRHCRSLLRVADDSGFVLIGFAMTRFLMPMLCGSISACLSSSILPSFVSGLLSFGCFAVCDIENTNIPKFGSIMLAEMNLNGTRKAKKPLLRSQLPKTQKVGNHRT